MIQIGEHRLDVEQAQLFLNNHEVGLSIEPKLFELLTLFVQQPNTILSRQEILDHLWPDSLVTDNAINKLIGNLRKLLRDDAKSPSYIQTVPKRGYRLICQVVQLEAPLPEQPVNKLESELVENSPPQKSDNRLTGTITLGLITIALSFIWIWLNTDKPIKPGYSIALTRSQTAEISPLLHPDNEHLYYLKASANNRFKLWVQNIKTSASKAVISDQSMSQLISIVEGEKTQLSLYYLYKKANECGVYQSTLSPPSAEKQKISGSRKLFDCSDKRLKDIDFHPVKNTIYYTAQPKNFWPNQIYAFDLNTETHRLVSQEEPSGWGHHTIDISPDGEKLLIMSTDSDYKTQLLSFNLESNNISKGVQFDHPVYEAIWHHDSKRVYYFSAPPAHQIMLSDFNGDNIREVISVSQPLSPSMSRLADGKNILFSTEQKNYNNRWLSAVEDRTKIDNATVSDTSPALLHQSEHYLFVSKRSGRAQLYLADERLTQAKIVSNLPQSHSLRYLTVAADDKSALVKVDNSVYLIPMTELSHKTPLLELNSDNLIYTSPNPIIALDWLTSNGIAITSVNNGVPKLIAVDLHGNKIEFEENRWAYGLTDSNVPQTLYLIEQQSNRLYQMDSSLLTAPNRKLTDTQIVLPAEFYSVKVDAGNLYYAVTENGTEYLHSVSLKNPDIKEKFLLNNFSSYDVSKGRIMISDAVFLQGDVHKTMY